MFVIFTLTVSGLHIFTIRIEIVSLGGRKAKLLPNSLNLCILVPSLIIILMHISEIESY